MPLEPETAEHGKQAAEAPAPEGRKPAGGRLSGRRRLVRTLAQTMEEMISDRVSLSAAGCAFYATLALFPAISMLVFIYGLAFDPHTVEPQLANLRTLVPPPAFTLIEERVHALVAHRGATLQLGLIVSVAVTYWSASTGTKSLLSALNLAYGEVEQRGFIGFQVTGLGMTLAAIIAAVLGLAILVGLPTAIGFLGLSDYQAALLRTGGLGGLFLFVLGALALLYRFGPSRAPGVRHVVMPGALVATLSWFAASELFSVYVTRVGRLDVTYGPLAAVVGVMMWFYVSAYVVLLGAELNAALEHNR
jgi:membrane protein